MKESKSQRGSMTIGQSSQSLMSLSRARTTKSLVYQRDSIMKKGSLPPISSQIIEEIPSGKLPKIKVANLRSKSVTKLGSVGRFR